MLFHTMVGSNDIERSKRFYDTVLATLGAGEGARNIADSGHTRLIYNNGNGTNFIVSQPINDEPASVANGSTVAFSCNSPEQIVSPPTRRGFGTRLIERSLRSYFRGETVLSYPPEGVEFRIKAPLAGAGELVTA